MNDLVIDCQKLNKWYGNVRALTDMDFQARRGEVIGLVGDNGAGKSTLIKILSGVHCSDGGTIFIEGKEVTINSPRAAMALGIETIYQYTAMAPEMSIVDNLFIGREPIRIGWRRFGWLDHAKMNREAVKTIEGLGLRGKSPQTLVKALSGGQMQGVTIARALYFKSKILILDEPTNHLSVKETNKLLGRILEIKSQGITCIFISHNLHHIYPISDRIVVMARGRKVADRLKQDTSVEEVTELISA